MHPQDWYYYDFLVVMADAYIDHPSFGSTLIARLLEAEGYRVAVLCPAGLARLHGLCRNGKAPVWRVHRRGNLDSMVAHYTVAKRRRDKDLYSPGVRWGIAPTGLPLCMPTGPEAFEAAHPLSSAGWSVAAALCPLRLLGR